MNAEEHDYRLRDWRGAGSLAPSRVLARLATVAWALVRFSPGRLAAEDMRQVERYPRLAPGPEI